MPRPGPAALELAQRFELALGDRALRGRAGTRLARGVGASVEFHDRRPYAPGDDVRHVDWRAYARREELHVRLHREEVLPRVDVLLDLSPSMGVEEEKAQRAVDLAALVAVGARRAGLDARLLPLDGAARPADLERFLVEGVELDGPDLAAALGAVRPALRAGALRVLVSDLLAPDAPAWVARLAEGAAELALLQVLGPADSNPPTGGGARLVDAETGQARELVLDDAAVARYGERLRRHGAALAEAAARRGARLATLDAGAPLEEQCRAVLVPAGVLVPASRARG